MNKINSLFFIFCFIISFSLFSQETSYSSKNKKAVQYFEKGLTHYYNSVIPSAIPLFEKAIQTDPKFIEPVLALGDIYLDQHEEEKAALYYKKALEINPAFFPVAWVLLGKIYVNLENYAEAKEHFEKALSFKLKEDEKKDVEKYLSQIDFRLRLKANPVPFSPQNMGENINSPFDEYLPYLTSDGKILIFTRRMPKTILSTSSTSEEEDLFMTVQDSNIWQMAEKMPPPVNSHGNEGSSCISQDGRYLFFTACDRHGGYGSCDIYWCEKEGDIWSVPRNLGRNVNSMAWESQPSLSIDGKTLYFSSNRKGGKGERDIWKTTLGKNGEWSAAVNLGSPINTEYDEVSPFIHYDDQTLYFSSNGHPGMGELDIFMSRRNADYTWNEPVNLGYPINTATDESGFVVDATGITAIISSDKPGGYGRQDLYTFELYPEVRPTVVTYMKGYVFDEITKRPLEASFQIIDLYSSLIIAESYSDKVTGEFLLSLPTHKNYVLNVSSEGYLFYSDHFEFLNTPHDTSFIKDIPLKPIKVGESIVLRNIFFDVNQYELKEESTIELHKLTSMLLQHPTLIVEIGGHTDNTGDEKANMVLSEKRANAVYQYLLEKDIPILQLKYKGYGQTKPVDTNTTESGKARNRRTECKIIST